MAPTVTLLIEPLPAGEVSTDLDATFREVDASAPALRVGELSTQRGDGIFETIGVVDGHARRLAPTSSGSATPRASASCPSRTCRNGRPPSPVHSPRFRARGSTR